MEKQNKMLNTILQKIQIQEAMLKATLQQVEQQQEALNMIFRQATRFPPSPPPEPFKSPVNILDKLNFDVEKLAKIAMILANLYDKNENEDKK